MGPDVHYRRTYAWALEEGFSAGDAERVARADAGYDELFPARRSLANITRHFSPGAWLWSAHYRIRAERYGDIVLLGWALHCAQDAVAHGRLGQNHMLLRLGLGRDPDVWDRAPEGVRRRVEAVSRALLRRYSRATARRRG
jgi:hypothetical protein